MAVTSAGTSSSTRRAARLAIGAGLGIELITLFVVHPLSFSAFLVLGVGAVALGLGLLLLAESRDRRASRSPSTNNTLRKKT